jgi:hypothetical protein
MNVEIGAEAEKEYISGIFLAVHVHQQLHSLDCQKFGHTTL